MNKFKQKAIALYTKLKTKESKRKVATLVVCTFYTTLFFLLFNIISSSEVTPLPQPLVDTLKLVLPVIVILLSILAVPLRIVSQHFKQMQKDIERLNKDVMDLKLKCVIKEDLEK